MENKNNQINVNEQLIKQVISQITKFSFIKANDFIVMTEKEFIIRIIRVTDKKSLDIDYRDVGIQNIMTECPRWIEYLKNKIIETFTDQTIEKNIIDTKQKWIVKFKNTCNPKDCAFPSEIKIKDIYCAAYHGICCKATEISMLKFCKNNEIVENFICDQKVYVQVLEDIQLYKKEDLITIAAQPIPTFIKRIGADHSSQKSGDGMGTIGNRTDINVFIFDTGISLHPELNIVNGRNFTTSDVNAWKDVYGHGTHVSGIVGAIDNDIGVVGVAPGVRLWAIKVIGDNGSGSTSTIITALNWVLSNRNVLWNGFGIINMSLGGPAFAPLDDAIKNVTDNGIVVCVAAGNSATNAISTSPARSPSAITVGATSPNPTYDTLASFSNYGNIVDILAPGTSINSTYLNNGYAIMSGTSMATPVITGTVALMVSTLNLGTPTTGGFVGNVSNTLKYVSSPTLYPNYDGTQTSNPRIILSQTATNAGTTNISVRSGSY
jgi:subtilisin family serine protease